MNVEWYCYLSDMICDGLGFRPQQGLTIMNMKIKIDNRNFENTCFRPQQGLTIMNQRQDERYAIW